MAMPRTGQILRSGLLTLWGLATLLLVLCLGLLLWGRVEPGDSPLELSVREAPAPEFAATLDDDAPTTTRDIPIYFADRGARRIEPELHTLPYVEDTVANCKAALDAMIQGPREGLTPVVPSTTEVRGIYMLDGGELVVDFSRELERGQTKTATTEMLMIRAIVTTLTQPRLRASGDVPIRSVRFLFLGSPPTDTFPAHIDLAEPVTFNREWIARGDEPPDV